MPSSSPLFSQKATPWGGRGMYASTTIPADQLVYICPSPYASVIYRAFRREVCAHCFAYALDAIPRRNAWISRYEGNGGTGGVWFCSEQCKMIWVDEETRPENGGSLLTVVNAAVDKLAQRLALAASKRATPHPDIETREQNALTPQYIEEAWNSVETRSIKANIEMAPLNELELDTVRFVLSGIIRLHRETVKPRLSDHPTPIAAISSIASEMLPPPIPFESIWADLLELQNNELEVIRGRPFILDSFLRIYTFIRAVVATSATGKIRKPATGSSITVLQSYIMTSDIVRAILIRDQGNTFGLYEEGEGQGGCEMLGFALFVAASYFNHNCSPNLRKERRGRAMHFYTTRSVAPDEELCISYVDTKDGVLERQAQLSQSWYFDCICQRCLTELAMDMEGKAELRDM